MDNFYNSKTHLFNVCHFPIKCFYMLGNWTVKNDFDRVLLMQNLKMEHQDTNFHRTQLIFEVIFKYLKTRFIENFLKIWFKSPFFDYLQCAGFSGSLIYLFDGFSQGCFWNPVLVLDDIMLLNCVAFPFWLLKSTMPNPLTTLFLLIISRFSKKFEKAVRKNIDFKVEADSCNL